MLNKRKKKRWKKKGSVSVRCRNLAWIIAFNIYFKFVKFKALTLNVTWWYLFDLSRKICQERSVENWRQLEKCWRRRSKMTKQEYDFFSLSPIMSIKECTFYPSYLILWNKGLRSNYPTSEKVNFRSTHHVSYWFFL